MKTMRTVHLYPISLHRPHFRDERERTISMKCYVDIGANSYYKRTAVLSDFYRRTSTCDYRTNLQNSHIVMSIWGKPVGKGYK